MGSDSLREWGYGPRPERSGIVALLVGVMSRHTACHAGARGRHQHAHSRRRPLPQSMRKALRGGLAGVDAPCGDMGRRRLRTLPGIADSAAPAFGRGMVWPRRALGGLAVGRAGVV